MTMVKDMKLIKRVMIVVMVLVIAIACLIVREGYQMYEKAMEEEPIAEKIKEMKEDKNYSSIKDLPEDYIHAVVAVEDHRFYQHKGIDPISIGRAIVTDIKAKALVEGGSTITQQVAKNVYFTQEKRLTRKIAEVFMTIQLEKNCSKEEILELYVNSSYFGDGYTGIKKACQGYFKKNPNEMNLSECTMLAGVPNAPSVYAPTKNAELAEQRQQQVIKKMVKYGYLTQEEADRI